MPMFNAVQTTYAFKDLTGVLDAPSLGGPFQLAGGNIGVGTITIRMLTQRTEHEVAADGVVMPSYIAGNNAEITIEMQQTSQLHHILLGLYNAVSMEADAGDIGNWAGMTLAFRTILDGSSHVFGGVSFQKVPDKPYASKGGNVNWILMAASAINQ